MSAPFERPAFFTEAEQLQRLLERELICKCYGYADGRLCDCHGCELEVLRKALRQAQAIISSQQKVIEEFEME